VLLLVPSDPLRPRRPDDHFAAEAAAAREAGLPVALIDHDALTQPGNAAEAVVRVLGDTQALYRGWMLRSEQYRAFSAALAGRGVTLRTSPEHYQRAHELPGWYARLATVTPKSVWTSGDDLEAFDEQRRQMGAGPAVLRDFTKSMKHYWHEAAFIPELSDGAAARAVAQRFRELRDDDFVGGFVLRRFEHFSGAEARTWWVDGRCVLTTAHPDTADQAPPIGIDLEAITPLVAATELPFVSVDLAKRADGAWRVIELGDGQVSDRPTTTDPGTFIAAVISQPDSSAS
jgi:hypothetical protein